MVLTEKKLRAIIKKVISEAMDDSFLYDIHLHFIMKYAQNYDILPHIYESADDKSWILVEYVIPAKAKDIKMCLGVDFNTFQRFVDTAYCYYSGEIDCYNQLSDEEFSEMCENSEWFESLYSYMADYQLPSGDLQRLANLGMVLRDGQPQIVILDSGLTQQIYDEYYRR